MLALLDLKRVLGAKPKEHVKAELTGLTTPWGESLDVERVLQEHPEPQLARKSFAMLNGCWHCCFVGSRHEATDDQLHVVATQPPPPAEAFDSTIVVPFSPESLLSGASRQLQPYELLWYRRTFDNPLPNREGRCLLHFQAVDYACAVYINGRIAGTHQGGYTPFALDITALLREGDNELMVCVADPSEFGWQLRGKQRFDRGDIWYTAQSGIWQSVWLEMVPSTYVESISLAPDARTGELAIDAKLAGTDASSDMGTELEVAVLDEAGDALVSSSCPATGEACSLTLTIPDVILWSPDNPHLYNLRITFGDDTVFSYCGFRTIATGKDAKGRTRILLNGEPLFVRGVLDQGYWSDGLMTAPADDALIYDIETMKGLGFNLMRKHIKIEASRWYYHCDRLGMLVLQDMVNGGSPFIQTWQWSYKPTLFKFSWDHFRDDTPRHRKKLGAGNAGYRSEWTSACRETLRLLGNHPSIIGWSLFNEGWGQFDASEACKMVRAADPTRLIDATSGWYDQGCGDFKSVHNYFRELEVWPDRKRNRAFFISEFGGLTYHIDGHSSLDEAYGYDPYDDPAKYRETVQELLAHMDSLEDQGLAGFIYTQLSDVEEETSGILTFDRRINKLAE